MPLILSGSAGLSGNVGTVTKDMLPAGSVLQVVQVVKTDVWTNTVVNTWQDITGMVASITPMSVASKILVQVHLNGLGVAAAVAARARLLRDGNLVYAGDAFSSSARGFSQNGGPDSAFAALSIVNFLDSPNTTSAVVYKVQEHQENANAVFINRTGRDNGTDARLVSSITLTEIKG